MKRTFAALLALTALAGAARPALAQAPATAPVVLTLPGSTRALALGGAYPIAQTESDAIFYNPAFTERLRGAAIGVQWAGSASTLYTLSAATEWLGGALGFGLLALDYHGAELGDFTLPAAAPADLLLRGAATISERGALVSYTRRVHGVRLAATGRLVEQRLDAERNTTIAADVAGVHDFGPVAAGLSFQNLGPGLEYADGETPLPLRIRLDASTLAAPLGPLDIALAGAVTWIRAGDVVPAAGVELSWWPVQGRTFYARGGVRRALEGEEPFSAGAGFSGDRLGVDYAWAPFDEGPVHRVTLRWR